MASFFSPTSYRTPIQLQPGWATNPDNPNSLAAQGITKPPDPAAAQQNFLAMLQSSSGPRVAPPNVSAFRYSQNTQDYPTFLRNLGEQQAQQAFQKNVQSGIQMGGGAQAYQKAIQQRNMERLGYMSQAGREGLGVEKEMAGAHNTYQDLLAKLYGVEAGQRSDELGYLASLNKASGGGGGSFTVGGGRSSGGGGSTSGGGSYIGLGGRVGSGMFDYGAGDARTMTTSQWVNRAR